MWLPWLQQMGRPPERKRIPVALTVAEVQTLLSHMAVLKVAAGGTASPLDALTLP